MHSTTQSAPATEVTNVGRTMKAAQKMISSFAVRCILFAYIGVTRDFRFGLPAFEQCTKSQGEAEEKAFRFSFATGLR